MLQKELEKKKESRPSMTAKEVHDQAKEEYGCVPSMTTIYRDVKEGRATIN